METYLLVWGLRVVKCILRVPLADSVDRVEPGWEVPCSGSGTNSLTGDRDTGFRGIFDAPL